MYNALVLTIFLWGYGTREVWSEWKKSVKNMFSLISRYFFPYNKFRPKAWCPWYGEKGLMVLKLTVSYIHSNFQSNDSNST